MQKQKKNICENENFDENFDFDRCKKYLHINIMKRSIFRTNKTKITKRYRFRKRMLFQIFRI